MCFKDLFVCDKPIGTILHKLAGCIFTAHFHNVYEILRLLNT